MNMKALVLTTTLPSISKQTGADIALKSFINAIQENGYAVTLVGYLRKNEESFEQPPEYISVGTCYVEMREAKLYPLIWLVKSFIKGLPFTTARYYSSRYIEAIRHLLDQSTYDLIFIDHSYQLGWLEPSVRDQSNIITIAHNVEYEVYRDRTKDANNFAIRWIYQRETRLVKELEDKLVKNVRQVWALTEYDSKYFINLVGADKVKVLGLYPSLGALPDETIEKQFDIGMIGSWIWKPNGDGLRWFFHNVYPQLPPELTIQVAGRGAEWLHNKYPNVLYQNFVPDAKQFMAQAKVIAIPSVSGGGIQIKTLDSIGLGLSIVATPFALRGIDNPPSTVKVAQRAEEFAKALISMVECPPSSSNDDAMKWSHARRAKFISDINDVMNQLSMSKEEDITYAN
jgi:hypothetical protein